MYNITHTLFLASDHNSSFESLWLLFFAVLSDFSLVSVVSTFGVDSTLLGDSVDAGFSSLNGIVACFLRNL